MIIKAVAGQWYASITILGGPLANSGVAVLPAIASLLAFCSLHWCSLLEFASRPLPPHGLVGEW